MNKFPSVHHFLHVPCTDMEHVPYQASLLQLLADSSDPELQRLLTEYIDLIPAHVYKEAESALPAAFAPGIQVQALCDALRWITIVGKISYVSSINVLLAPQGYLITVTAEVMQEKKKQQVEHIPIALARSPALLAHIQVQLPSIKNIVKMWDQTYRKIENSEIKDTFGKLLQIKGQEYKKVNTTLFKNIVLTPMEQSLPVHLKTIWGELQKSGLQCIQEQLFRLPDTVPFTGTATVTRSDYLQIYHHLLAWASDKLAPPHKQNALRNKGILQAMNQNKAQDIIRQSILEVATEAVFEEAWRGEKPSWITAPTAALLKPKDNYINLLNSPNLLDMKKTSRTSADLLQALDDGFSQKEEEPLIPEHFTQRMNAQRLETTKADLDHIKTQHRQAENTIKLQNKQIEELQSTIKILQAELQEMRDRSETAELTLPQLTENFANAFAMLVRIRQKASEWEGPPSPSLVDLLKESSPENFTCLPPLHAKYMASVPLVSTFLAVTGIRQDLLPIITALIPEHRPTTVNLLKYLNDTDPVGESPTHNTPQSAQDKTPVPTVKTQIPGSPPMHKLLKWINHQPTEKISGFAKKLHMTVSLNIPEIRNLSPTDLHEQWNTLNMHTTHPKLDHVIKDFFTQAEQETPQDPISTGHTIVKQAEHRNQQAAQTPQSRSSDPAKFPICILVAWNAVMDPPEHDISARILGTALRPVFEKNLCSITDDSVKGTRSFCMLGVSEDGKDQANTPGMTVVSGWRINWKKATKQPWSPWVPRGFHQASYFTPEASHSSGKKKQKKGNDDSSESNQSDDHKNRRESSTKKKENSHKKKRSRSRSKSRSPKRKKNGKKHYSRSRSRSPSPDRRVKDTNPQHFRLPTTSGWQPHQHAQHHWAPQQAPVHNHAWPSTPEQQRWPNPWQP